MRKGNIGVAPEGLPFLFLLALTALAFAALRFWPLALVFLVLTWFSGHFFRDPERVVPSEDDIATTRSLAPFLAKLGVELVDHLIFVDDDMVSLRESGFYQP